MTAAELAGLRMRQISRIALGAIWLIDGILQFQPAMFSKTFISGVILPNAMGQPGILASPITWLGHQLEPHVALFNAGAATLQVALGLAMMHRRTVKLALAASFVWAAVVWFAGEGLGGVLTGAASPLTGAPGAALLYIVVGLMVWPRQAARERGMRLAWAGLWLVFAGLWLLPANSAPGSVHDAIESAPTGTGWLAALLHTTANATSSDGSVIAATMAALSAAIALAAITRTAERAFLGLAIALSLMFWILGQGFGGIFTGSATDVSTGPLVILMACILLSHILVVRDTHTGRLRWTAHGRDARVLTAGAPSDASSHL